MNKLLQHLIRKPVKSRVADCENSRLLGTALTGTILSIGPEIVTVGPKGRTLVKKPFTVVELDPPLTLRREVIQWIATIPRYHYQGLYQLYFRKITVNVHSLSSPEPPREVDYESYVLICEMSIKLL